MKKLLCLLLLLPLLAGGPRAEALGEQMGEALGAGALEESLTEEERSVGGKLRFDGGYDAAGALQRLWTLFLTKLRERISEETRFAASLLANALLCALACAAAGKKSLEDVVQKIACCSLGCVFTGSLDSVILQTTDAMNRLSDLSRISLPLVFTAAAAGGAAGSAPLRYGAACLAMDVLMSASHALILPLIYAYLSLSVSASIFENPFLRAVQRLVKSLCIGSMTVLTMAFSAYLSLTGLVAGSTDAIAVKTARAAISTLLPVVGGILSDSASVLIGAAGVIRATAGLYSLFAVLSVCAGPFALLSVKMLLFKLASAASDVLPGGSYARLLSEIGLSFGMLLGLLGCSGVMLFVSIMSGVRTVSG